MCSGNETLRSKPDAVPFYGRHGLIELEVVEGQSDARPQPTPMFLSMRAIKSAAT